MAWHGMHLIQASAGELNRFSPFLGFFFRQLAELRRRQWQSWPRAACLLWGAHCEKAEVEGAQLLRQLLAHLRHRQMFDESPPASFWLDKKYIASPRQ
jgi:hypothetical protein